MDDDFVKEFIQLMTGFWAVLVFLMFMSFIVTGCDSGWSIAGWEVK